MERDEIFQEDTSNRSPLALDQDTLLDDQFRVGRVLGVGGFGITYLAFDEVLKMVVAVKEYLPNDIAVRKTNGNTVQPLSSGEGKQDFQYGLERFLQEARTLAKFERHPNIVRVRTFFQENGTGYLVMNFYEGRTLAEYLEVRNGFIPEQEALLIMDQVLDGLAVVHEEGILHRDIDPNNVYLADDGTVVLLDFGAARTAVGERTQSMSVVLKRGYAPHEQYHSYGDQGPWTDVYASAATMYRALTGYKPPEAAARILDDDLAPPVELVPSLSDATNEAIIEGLSVRPEDRPQTVEAFASILPSPEDAEPHWVGEDTTLETAGGTGDGSAELQVTATHSCRLYVDGRRTAHLPAKERFTIGVEAGTHRLRAVRTDQQNGGSATVTASESDVETEGDEGGRFTLESLVWQDVVSASDSEPTAVEIDFDDDTGAATASPPTEEVEETIASAAPGESGGTETMGAPETEAERAPGILTVEANRAGTLYVDEERWGAVDAEKELRVEVTPGTHELRVEADDDSSTWSASVEVESGASRSVRVALDAGASTTAEDSTGIGRGVMVGAGVGGLVVLLVLGWVLLGERAPGPSPSALGDRIVPSKQAARDAGRALLDGGETVASRGMATVNHGMTDALVWMDLYNRPPEPRPDSIVATDRTLVNVRENDRDPEGEALRVVSAGPTATSMARFSVVDSAHLRVRPTRGFAGTVEIPYMVVDAHGKTQSSSVVVQVPFSGSTRWVTDDVEEPQVVQADSLGDDRDLDVVMASLGRRAVSWSENDLAARDSFLTPHPIDTTLDGAVDIRTADLTGNGKRDVIVASLKDDAVAWYENQGDGDFGRAQYITKEADGAVSVRATDVDGDGDEDVIAGALLDETVTWYENEGDGTFGNGTVFAEGIKGLETIHVTDLDSDGVPGVLVVSYQDSTISRYELEEYRTDSVHFARRKPVGTHLREPIEVHTADLTGNGRADVLVGKAGVESLIYFENRATTEDTLRLGNKRVLTTELQTVEAIESGDIDQDGDQDLFAASFDSGKIVWFKNFGDGSFGSPHPITRMLPNVITIDVADVDGDGDLDVLSASQAENSVVWYENHIQ